jgi:predicted CDP-diglyceride synthetase/phosphatidate cytidylyltransferase
MKFIKDKTQRGFSIQYFYDDYDVKCNIQQSSNNRSCIWLGTDKAEPKILASKTKQGGTGWVDYDIPSDVLISHRMHLNRHQSLLLGLKLLLFGLIGKLN